MITIPKNDYVQPTEVREEVVKGICEAFLNGCCWSIFHPVTTSPYRRKTMYIVKHKRDNAYYGFHDEVFLGEEGVRFNGAEMKEAFRVLNESGYYIWNVREFGAWKGYMVTKQPHCDYEGAIKVTEFSDFID